MARAAVWEEDGSDDGGDDDDDDVYRVVMSVASADEVREEAMRAAEEAVDECRAVVSSSLGFSEHRCESGKAVATSGRLAPEGRNGDFTVRSSDIGKKKLKNKQASKKARKGRGHG
jgi:hypothetical protein